MLPLSSPTPRFRPRPIPPLESTARRATPSAPRVSPLPLPRSSWLVARATEDDKDDDGDDAEPLLLTNSTPAAPSSSSSSTTTSATTTTTTSNNSPLFFNPPDEESAWLAQYLPFSRLSLDALAWLAANAEREELPAPGATVLSPGQSPPSLVVVRSGRVGVARASSSSSSSAAAAAAAASSSENSTNSRYTAAGPGASFGASDLLANRPSRCDIVTLDSGGSGGGGGGVKESSSSSPSTSSPSPSPSSKTVILRITPKILSELASKFPGAERALLSGTLDAGEEAAAAAAADADALRAELDAAARRSATLQPYLVTSPKRGIVGVSKYASRLRKEIITASRDPSRGPVFVFGEPGLNKDNVAALVHFGSPDNKKPMVCVDCGRLSGDGADLFGRGARPGLLSALRDGTLLLNNVHLAPPALADALVQLLASGSYTRAPSPRRAAGAGDLAPVPILRSDARIMITAERRAPRFEALMTVIRVPPLRVRPADVAPLAEFFLRDLARRTGAATPPTLSAAALRQLEAYSFPDNIAELQASVERAAVHSGDKEDAVSAAAAAAASSAATAKASSSTATAPTTTTTTAVANQVVPAAGLVSKKTTGDRANPANLRTKKGTSMPLLASVDGATISADALWFAAAEGDRGRLNLLQTLPWLKQFVRGEFWRDTLPFKIVAPIYVVYVAYLFLGPQDRAHNFGLNLFWCWWWPGSFVIYPFLGRIWCGSICPFMIFGEIAQKLRNAVSKTPLKKWPRDSIEQWGPWFLYALFFVILVWERVWELSDHAALSAWLLLIITAGAVICSVFYERRLWCRYLCPIGGMQSCFSSISCTELRARKGVCSSNCSTYHCFKGGPAEAPEGLETDGCPLYSHPANLVDNKDCVLCFTCEAACPHRSVEFRVRPLAADLWSFGHSESAAELCLMFMLLGAVGVHHLPQVASQLGFGASFVAEQLTPHEGLSPSFLSWHALAATILMAAPAAIVWGVDALWQAGYKFYNGGGGGGGGIGVSGGGGSGSKGEFAALLASASSSSSSSTTTTTSSPSAIPAFLTRAPPRLTRVAYAYLPLTWAGTLAHYEEWGLREAGTVARVFARSLEDAELILHSLAELVPAPAADPAVVSFLQGSTLLLGAVGAAAFTRRLGARPWAQLVPQLVGISLVTAELWWLILGGK